MGDEPRKDEVLERLCRICGLVGKHHGWKYAADCFCDPNAPRIGNYAFDDEILDFVEEAVREKIARA